MKALEKYLRCLKIKNAAGGAKLHHPPRDRVKFVVLGNVWVIFIIEFDLYTPYPVVVHSIL